MSVSRKFDILMILFDLTINYADIRNSFIQIIFIILTILILPAQQIIEQLPG